MAKQSHYLKQNQNIFKENIELEKYLTLLPQQQLTITSQSKQLAATLRSNLRSTLRSTLRNSIYVRDVPFPVDSISAAPVILPGRTSFRLWKLPKEYRKHSEKRKLASDGDPSRDKLPPGYLSS
ncbi:hypothetical protein DPMN_114126 [Dreissena polymorpha]|uniref:Uncharacterized protein n=1 Tax=Dreissena polymorpha TaxID=45954 RepID=A0A9D4KJX8_DREPO|nr:hypothetical protein DPMN_114126 [Dreissena polymorpha]